MTIFFAVFLLGALISVPVWIKILKKMNNNKKTYLMGSFILCGLIVPLFFFQTDIDLMIIMFLVGFGNGSVWTIGMPVLYSNVQDDFLVRNGKNQKGIMVGTWAVISLITAFISQRDTRYAGRADGCRFCRNKPHTQFHFFSSLAGRNAD